MSGHSKWSTIKHKKAAKDAKRGKIFTRIGKEITIAAREKGGDIESNPRLRLAVQNAKAVNMPAENIKRAIQKGTGELEGATYEEYTYEGYAPLGVAVILETVTDNKNRTYSEIKSQFGKLGGNIGEPNSVAWNFDRKGVITITTGNKSEDELLELVLESGADDLEYSEDSSRVICQMESFGEVNKFFTDKKITIEESKLEYLPKTTIEIKNVDDARRVMKFIEAFEDHDDVQNVFTNMDISDDIMEKL
ncbi:YebC/PmpR family DNA-binding transcriptional regulator [Bacteroidetes/Chlorobi group bacterium ChocPot_Mid]|jgi:YebC/PmpR family DNA-binding regulatory protein|nr:MAG: YebC/PmpR family DNA-binding transcriptional regulator [Bacteroidetes/Chlorobi group bacterium ChocPot_Mid]